MLAELADHPHARAVLGSALGPGGAPSHAYLFHGPGGAGKRAAARALAAELLAEGSVDPEGSRARVRSGAHPDLTWVAPSGAHEILVSDIDGPVVAAATRTPFESARRLFVIERADELGEEAANRMLKTLEEPPAYVHLILLSDRPMDVLPTIRSRCQMVRFDPPPAATVAAGLRAQGLSADTAEACSRLALGDADLAGELARPEGVALREGAEALVRATLAGETEGQPWRALRDAVRARGEAVQSELEERRDEELAFVPGKEVKRLRNEWEERVKRGRRRRERTALDLGLGLVSLWLADLAALAWEAGDLVRAVDRLDALRDQRPLDATRLPAAIDAVEDTRQRLLLNVSDELALEALTLRLEELLAR